MDATRWARLRGLLEDALALPAHERAPFLQGACPDADLRAEVHALLAAESRGGEVDDAFLAPPTQPLPDVSDEAPTRPLREPVAGERVGGFRLVRVLGRGGMGSVWLAEQDQPRRAVALKMLHTGLGAGSSRRRFVYESEILARLRHPGIAQIFEVGLHDVGGGEVPWFALELVENAQDVIAYCGAQRLDRTQRCRLFVDVCDAVQHGHARGIVHRDIKSANLLVDEQGRVKVIDFGVARAELDGVLDSMATLPGQIVGTLRSMSPEQIAGRSHDVDVRSDVYSLGLVLYELCCGRPPYELASLPLAQVARVVQERAPARPTAGEPSFPGDLEAILLRCLEKEPDRRYRSAGELGDDMLRFLDGQPVLARPPSTIHHLRLLARRHRALVAGATFALLALVGATAVSMSFAYSARREAARAELALAAEEEARRAALDFATSEARQRALAEEARDDEAEQRRRAEVLFANQLELGLSLVIDIGDRLRRLEGGSTLSSDLLVATADQLERLTALADPTDTEVRALLAEAHLRLGDARGNPMANNQLGDATAAAHHYDRAAELTAEIAAIRAGDAEDATVLRLESDLALRRGDLHFGADDGDAARAEYTRGLQLLGRLARVTSDDPAAALDVAVLHNRIGRVAVHEGLTSEALEDFLRALDAYDRVLALDEAPASARTGRAATLSKVGNALYSLGDLASAETMLDEAEHDFTALAEADPSDAEPSVGLVQVRMLRGAVAFRRDDVDAAVGFSEAALRLAERLATNDPDNARFPLLAGGLGVQLAQTLLSRALSSDDPRPDLRAALDVLERSLVRLHALEARGALPPQEAGLLGLSLTLRDRITGLLEQSGDPGIIGG